MRTLLIVILRKIRCWRLGFFGERVQGGEW
jgi:hypothetical protein